MELLHINHNFVQCLASSSVQDQLEIEQKKTKEDQWGSTGFKSGGSCDFPQESIPTLSTKVFFATHEI